MARKSLLEKNKKREGLVAKYAVKRAEIKQSMRDPGLSIADHMLLYKKLLKLPRYSTKICLTNRCVFSGRARGVYSKLRISRIVLRELASDGRLPGVKKYSW
jgi:small subunit ribosomal protein S14